jgi:hypothetical protein
MPVRRFPLFIAPLSLALYGMLGGCATGSSLSLSQAPLSYVVTEDGGYEVAARDDGTAQALVGNGSFEAGMPGFQAVGGNALLPVAVQPVALSANAAGLAAVSVSAAPTQVTASLAAPGVTTAVTAATAPLTGAVTPVTAPILTTATQSLTTLGPVLGTVTRPVAPVASAANDAILAAVAAALARRCC